MGAVTKIEWCHHTFNPWWGCPLCDRCYAMMLDTRWFKRAHWGPRAPRRYFGDAYWSEPLKWDCLAGAERRRRRVFCASMADVFDNASMSRFLTNKLRRLIRRRVTGYGG